MKPTYGRVSRYGMIAFASSLDQGGPITRSAEDAAILLGVMAGFDERDSTSIDKPVPDYSASLNEAIDGLKVGLPKEFFGEGLDDGVARAISLGDAAAIRSAPGIGPKLAQRLIIELKDKAPAIMALGAAGASPARIAKGAGSSPGSSPDSGTNSGELIDPSLSAGPGAALADSGNAAAARADALSALVNLGYGQGEAAGAIAEAMGTAPDADAPGLIRLCLRLLAPKG